MSNLFIIIYFLSIKYSICRSNEGSTVRLGSLKDSAAVLLLNLGGVTE